VAPRARAAALAAAAQVAAGAHVAAGAAAVAVGARVDPAAVVDGEAKPLTPAQRRANAKAAKQVAAEAAASAEAEVANKKRKREEPAAGGGEADQADLRTDLRKSTVQASAAGAGAVELQAAIGESMVRRCWFTLSNPHRKRLELSS